MTTQLPLLSIIIPVYNTPPFFLHRCAASLWRQAYDNLEVIFIDDGSSCDYQNVWAQIIEESPCQIQIIQQANKGVSAARNRGLKAATGDYIMFVDPDDELCAGDCIKEAIESLIRTGADAAFGRVAYRFDNVDFDYPFGFGAENAIVINSHSDLGAFAGYFFSYGVEQDAPVPPHLNRGPVAKIFKRRSLGDISFDERLKYAEDAIFNSEATARCQSIVLIDSIWYLYYQYENSISHSDKLETCHQQCQWAQEHVNGEQFGGAYESYCRHCILEACINKVRTGGVKAYGSVKEFTSQKWVREMVGRSRYSCYRVSDWENRLADCIEHQRYGAFFAMLMFGRLYMRLRRKKPIDPGRATDQWGSFEGEADQAKAKLG